MKRVLPREHFTYRCQYCGAECVKSHGLASGLVKTKLGDYGGNGTPTPTTYDDEMYTASTISFQAASGSVPAKILDSASLFGDKHFQSGMTLVVATDSGTNDGTYTIDDRGVLMGSLSLISTDTLTDETAAVAGEVTISRRIYEPNVTTGCNFCGSLNSRKH